MPNIYVRSTDGVNTDDGLTWANAKLDLAGAAAIDALGDTIYVSQNHAESTVGAITIAIDGTPDNPTRILCANDATTPPNAVAESATVSTTGTGAINITGSVYCRGVTFSAGTGAGSGASNISLAVVTSPNVIQEYENVTSLLTGSNSASAINMASSGSSNTARSSFVWKNVHVKTANQGQRIDANTRFHWRGGSILAGSATAVNGLFRSGAQGRGSPFMVEGVNFTNLPAASNLVDATNANGLIVLKNCRLPAGWTGSLIAGAMNPNLRVEMYNCDNADTNYRLWIEAYQGTIKSETTIVRTGGASDGATGLSWKMTSTANTKYPTTSLSSGEIVQWNQTTGTPITATVEFIHDSAIAEMNDEVWLEVQYLGTNGFPLSSFITNAKADVLTANAAQPAPTAAWTTTGLTTPNKQQLSVTFTPQEKGFIHARVHLAAPSKTIYVDPLMTVT